MATQNIQLSAKTLTGSIDTALVDINAFVIDSEGTKRYVSSSLSLSKTRKAGPILFILSTPRSQNVVAASTGTQIGTFSDISVTVYQIYNGVTTTLGLTSLTATSPDLAGISTNPGTGVITLNTQTLSSIVNNTNISITATVTDSEGTIRSINDSVSVSKTAKGAPVLQITVSPTVQNAGANSTGQQVQSFSDVYVTVTEIYNNLVSDKTITNLTATTPDIAGISTTPAIGLISLTGKTLPTAVTSTSASIGATVVDSEGTVRTLSSSFSLAKTNGSGPTFNIEINPVAQSTTAKSTGVQDGTFSDILVVVRETYTGSTSVKTLTSLTATCPDIASIVTIPSTGIITLNGRTLGNNIASTTASVGATITDSEGISRTFSGSFTLSKTSRTIPTLQLFANPISQTVAAKSTGEQTGSFSDVVVVVQESYTGSVSIKTLTSLTAISPAITNIVTTPSTGVITLNGRTLGILTSSTSASIGATVTDSEGISRTLSGSISLAKAKSGRPPIIFTITPSVQNVAATSTGTVTGTIIDPIVSGSEGYIPFTYVSHSSPLSGNGEFRIVGISGDMTVANPRPSNSVIDVTGLSAATVNTNVVTMSFVDFEGTPGTASIAFQINKAIAGRPTVVFTVYPNQVQTLPAYSNGNLITTWADPVISASSGTSSFTYASHSANLSGTGEFRIVGISSPSITVSNPRPPSSIIDVTALASASNTAFVTMSYVDFEGTPGTASVYFSINKNLAGAPGTVFTIVPQVQSVDTDSGGTVIGTFVDPVISGSSNSGSSVAQLFRYASHSANLSGSGEFRIVGVSSTGITVANPRPSSSRLDVTAISSATNIAYVTMSYVDFEGTPGTASIYFQINKSTAGGIGRRSASNIVYYQISSSTTPSTPSATSYRFSTNTFTGLTANWGVTPPIYSGSNTYKYWYSPYVANEDSSSADTATTAFTSLSFSTPKQAIGFDGLVTFINSDAINDNKGNSLSFGSTGTTTILGDNISTGRIISTNFTQSTGLFTSGGVELNLTTNILRGTGFYIDDNQALFAGTISSSAGNIGGWAINPTSITADLSTGGKISIDSIEPSITISSGSSNETVVSISGLDELTPIATASIFASASTATVSRSLADSVGPSAYGPTPPGNVSLTQTVANYSASLTNASSSFLTNAFQSGSFTIRVQLSGSLVSSSGIISRTAGTATIGSFTAAGTVGVYIRSGSNANDATALVGTISKTFTTSSANIGGLTSTVEIRNINTGVYYLSQNVVLKPNTRYFLVPFVSNTTTTMGVSSVFGDTENITITQRINTPIITSASIQQGINKIELVAGGFQVIRDAVSYFRARRGGTSDSAAAPFLASGGNFRHTGDFTVTGTLSKGGGSFQIPHPLLSRRNSHYLIHSFIEGPKMDLIYRGKATLTDGIASVNIDSDSNMTDGTFEVLCRDVQCFTSNETGWSAVKGSVSGNILNIESENTSSNDTISWMVVGQRKDDFTKTSSITDMYGNLLVEKPIE